MKQVNLLPYSLQQRASQKRLVMSSLLALILALAGSGFLQVSVRMINDSFSDPVVSGAQPTTSATPRSEDDIKKRIKAINGLTAAEIDWHKAFSLVQGLSSVNLSTSAFTISNESGATTIKTVGVAPSNAVFASYLETLEEDKRVVSVVRDTYSYAPDKGTVNFALTITVDPNLMRYVKP